MSDLIERLSRINDPSLYDELCLALEAAGDPTLIAARASSLRKAQRCLVAVLADMIEPAVDVRAETGRHGDHFRDAAGVLRYEGSWPRVILAFSLKHGLVRLSAEAPPAAARGAPSD